MSHQQKLERITAVMRSIETEQAKAGDLKGLLAKIEYLKKRGLLR